MPSFERYIVFLVLLIFPWVVATRSLRGGSNEGMSVLEGESMRLGIRSDVQDLRRADPDSRHTLVFGVQMKNLDELERRVNEVSTPGNPNYGHHMTKAQVDELTRDQEAQDAVLHFFDSRPAFTVHEDSRSKNYIDVTASVHEWETLLSAEFHEYAIDRQPSTVIRCPSFRVPAELVGKVSVVMNTVQLPPAKIPRPQPRPVHL